MPKLFQSLFDIHDLREEDYVFTLDHDGGLVVSWELVKEAGALDSQFEGIEILQSLEAVERQYADDRTMERRLNDTFGPHVAIK